VLRICEQTDRLTGLSLSDLEPRFGRRSYEDLLVKTQSFATLTAAGMPSIQAFTFSKLSKDPESDAIVYEAHQEETARELDAMSGATHRHDEPDEAAPDLTEATVSQSTDRR
jgi:hypothetical protein